MFLTRFLWIVCGVALALGCQPTGEKPDESGEKPTDVSPDSSETAPPAEAPIINAVLGHEAMDGSIGDALVVLGRNFGPNCTVEVFDPRGAPVPIRVSFENATTLLLTLLEPEKLGPGDYKLLLENEAGGTEHRVSLLRGEDGQACWDLDGDGTKDQEEDANADGTVDVQDCRGPSATAGQACWDLDGNGKKDEEEDTNADGTVDVQDCRGPSATAGQACWDLDGDGTKDQEEDANADGTVDVQDCRGPSATAGQACWDLDGDGKKDEEEDVNADGTVDVQDCRGEPGRPVLWQGSLAEPPASPEENWLYYDTTQQKNFWYRGDAWVELGPGGQAEPPFDLGDEAIPPMQSTALDYQVQLLGEPTAPVTFYLLAAPQDMAINAATGQVTWEPGPWQAPGDYSFLVLALDAAGHTAYRGYVVSLVDIWPPEAGGVSLSCSRFYDELSYEETCWTNEPFPDVELYAYDADLMRLALTQADLEQTTWIEYQWYYEGFDLSIGGDGPKEVLAQFADLSGNASEVVVQQVVLDTAAPQVSEVVLEHGEVSTDNLEVAVTVSVLDPGGRIARIIVSESEEAPVLWSSNDDWYYYNEEYFDDFLEVGYSVAGLSEAYTEFTVDTPAEQLDLELAYTFQDWNSGQKTLYVWTVDLAGNLSDAAQASIELHSPIVFYGTYGTEEAEYLGYLPRADAEGFTLIGLYDTWYDFWESEDTAKLLITFLDAQGEQDATRILENPRLTTLTAAVARPDGGYLVAGLRTVEEMMVPTILALDASGDLVWQHTYPFDQPASFTSMNVTLDGGFIAAGYVQDEYYEYEYYEMTQEPFLLRADAEGHQLWQSFPEMGTSTRAVIGDVLEAEDGGFLWPLVDGDAEEAWLIKSDVSGDELWRKSLPSSFNVTTPIKARTTAEGGYLVLGSATSYLEGGLKVYKLDSERNLEWTYTTDEGEGIAWAVEVLELPDGGFLLLGQQFSGSYPQTQMYAILLHLDAQGQLLDTLPIQGVMPNDLRLTESGAVALSGCTFDYENEVADQVLLLLE